MTVALATVRADGLVTGADPPIIDLPRGTRLGVAYGVVDEVLS